MDRMIIAIASVGVVVIFRHDGRGGGREVGSTPSTSSRHSHTAKTAPTSYSSISTSLLEVKKPEQGLLIGCALSIGKGSTLKLACDGIGGRVEKVGVELFANSNAALTPSITISLF